MKTALLALVLLVVVVVAIEASAKRGGGGGGRPGRRRARCTVDEDNCRGDDICYDSDGDGEGRCFKSCDSGCRRGVCDDDTNRCVMCVSDDDCEDNRRGDTCVDNRCE